MKYNSIILYNYDDFDKLPLSIKIIHIIRKNRVCLL